MTIQMRQRKRFVYVCPECDKHRDEDTLPDAKFWPHCEECGESMNVYIRGQEIRLPDIHG